LEKGDIVRRLTLSLGIVAAALGLIAPPATVAANPQVNHFKFSDTFRDTDFCGTGMTVNISAAGHGTEFLAPNQPVDYRQTIEGNVTFTNPLNGKTVINHFANTFSDTTISGDPDGLHVHEFTFKGLPEMLRMEHGRVLLRDAGYLIFHQTFDGDEFISSEIFVDKGPHPDAESDFALFCEVMTSALALS
jgi:hypothetical protein